jgi:hypothetical protein
MTRSVLRYVPHTIRHVAEGGLIFELFCAAPDCGETSGPLDTPEPAQDWALRHTGRNPAHDLFRRVATDHARVTRAE